MGKSLQDQLLKAGLVNKDQVKEAKKSKYKQQKQKKPRNQVQVDEGKAAAQQAIDARAERDRELNKEKQQKLERKSIAAQIRQLIELNREARSEGDVGYNFLDGKKVKKIYVTEEQHNKLSRGVLAIVKLDNHYDLIPKPVANKISERDAHYVIVLNEAASNEEDEDDYYADFKIPDDLMW